MTMANDINLPMCERLRWRKSSVRALHILLLVAMAAVAGVGNSKCFGFGEDGHAAIYEGAFKTLQALNPDRCAIPWPKYTVDGKSIDWLTWRGISSVYPDEIVVYHTDSRSLSQLGVDAIIGEFEKYTGNKIDETTRNAILDLADPEHANLNYLLLLQNSSAPNAQHVHAHGSI